MSHCQHQQVLPVMMDGQQHQQAPGIAPQQPQVVVMQQPVVVLNGRKRGRPYLLRGARFKNGCRCPGFCIAMLASSGLVILFTASLHTRVLGIPVISCLIIVGGFLSVSGMVPCHTARKQFKALPPDHPHRFKYGTGYRLPIQTVNGVTTYQLPPGSQLADQNIPTGPVTAGQTGPYFPQAAGSSVAYPAPTAGQPGSPIPHAILASYPSPGASQYKDDLPPPYSAVVTKE